MEDFLLEQSFTAHMPLLMATGALGLRRRWTSPQWYPHHLHTILFTQKQHSFKSVKMLYRNTTWI